MNLLLSFQEDSWLLWAIIAAAVVFVLILVVICVILSKKKKNAEAKNAKPAKAQSSAQPAKAQQSSAKPAEEKKPAPAAKKEEPAKPAPAAKKEEPEEEKKASTKTYHISKRKDDGKWQVKFAGGSKAIKLFDTQAEAIDYAKVLADNQEGKIVIHKEDGSFRRLTYGNKK